MSIKVNLPPGCSGFDCKDGTKYTASKPGGAVSVDDRHAAAINKGQYGQQDFISATGGLSFGTRKSRHCASCRRIWNAWSTECPRCGEPTAAADD